MKKIMWLSIACSVVLLDQLTKYWAFHSLSPYEPMPIFPMINMTLAFNTGAAFSFLSGVGSWHRWLFPMFSLLMSLGLFIWLIKLPKNSNLQGFALAFILGGAVGNLIDRAFWGYVVDFIDVYYKNNHWPDFNLADSAICFGAVLLFIHLARHSEDVSSEETSS